MRVVLLITLCFTATIAARSILQKIVGGSVTDISEYPNIVSLLYSMNLSTYWQSCGGTVINVKAVLTAAHCPAGDEVNKWRVRVGSTYSNSGGVVHSLEAIIIHPNYNTWNLDNDIAILRTVGNIVYTNNAAQPALIAGSNYNLGDDQPVWAAGWGVTSVGGQLSEQLRHVQIWTVNQEVCANRYSSLGFSITENMLCSGWLDVGGRDQCQGDSGGPLYHNDGVLVGICSWGWQCALPFFPGVNVRVSRYTSWIQASASDL